MLRMSRKEEERTLLMHKWTSNLDKVKVKQPKKKQMNRPRKWIGRQSGPSEFQGGGRGRGAGRGRGRGADSAHAQMNRKTIWTKWMSNNRPGKRRKLTSSHTTRRRRRIEFEFIQAWHHFPSTLLAFIFFSKLFLWSDYKLWEKLKKQARNSNLITDKGVKWEVSSAHLASSVTAMVPPTESKCRLFYSVQSRIFWSVNIIDVEIQRPPTPPRRPFNAKWITKLFIPDKLSAKNIIPDKLSAKIITMHCEQVETSGK